MTRLNVEFPDGVDAQLDELVEADEFGTKAEAIRYYVRSGLQREEVPA